MIYEWRIEWPDEVGEWWFYGWKFGEIEEKPRRSLVKVSLTGNNSFVIVGDGHFWYAEEGAIGLFVKADLPDLPTEAIAKMKFDISLSQ